MAPKFRTILFDLDGTLIDHFAAIHRSHVHTLRHFGLPEPTFGEVRRAVGLGLEHAIRQLAGPGHAAIVPQALPIYREYWTRTLLDDVKVLPGAHDLLHALKLAGVRTAVLTNKHGPSARTICAHLALTPLLHRVIGAMDTPWHKPEPRLTLQAVTELGGDVATSLFVGDSPYDIQAAHGAGLPCWVVTTGTHTSTELQAASADSIFTDLAAVQLALVGSKEQRRG